MKEPYRFIKRASRKNIYVVFEHLPDREFSTGTDDMRKAIVFAETMLREDWHKFDRENYKMTFGEYAKDFFTDEDPRGFRKPNCIHAKSLKLRSISHLHSLRYITCSACWY